jgi:hypothetical protein
VERSSTACTLESSENGHNQSTRPSRTCLSWLEGEVWEVDSIKTFDVQSELIYNSILEVTFLAPKSVHRLVISRVAVEFFSFNPLTPTLLVSISIQQCTPQLNVVTEIIPTIG